MSAELVVLNAVATWAMVGVIWIVQLVHYPLLALVGHDRSMEVAVRHQRAISFVVGPPMAVEGITTLALLGTRPDSVPVWLPWAGAVSLAVALGCTVLLSVPRHARMAANPDPVVGAELVRTNWPRTVAWTAHGLITAAMLWLVVA
jgi:hypothetical protein